METKPLAKPMSADIIARPSSRSVPSRRHVGRCDAGRPPERRILRQRCHELPCRDMLRTSNKVREPRGFRQRTEKRREAPRNPPELQQNCKFQRIGEIQWTCKFGGLNA